MLEEIGRLHPSVRFNLINFSRIAAAKKALSAKVGGIHASTTIDEY